MGDLTNHKILEFFPKKFGKDLQIIELGSGFTPHFLTLNYDIDKYIEVELDINTELKKEALDEIRSIIRNANGKSILWSTMFDVDLNSNSVLLSGKGFGHGVGLCQWGAISLSRNGWNYSEILDHYYPGISIESVND